MEVHAPHHPLNSWRDFLIHIATITVGLLIAIGLEQTVEFFHHRHLAHAARENIRRELESNSKAAEGDLKILDGEIADMKANAAAMRSLRDDPKAQLPSKMRFDFDWSSFDQAAWTTSRDSLALTYLPTEEVQRYTDIYDQQELVNQYAVATLARQVEAAAPLVSAGKPENLKPDEVVTLVHETSVVAMRLATLRQFIQQLDRQYGVALKKEH
jgi:hypothetical protein